MIFSHSQRKKQRLPPQKNRHIIGNLYIVDSSRSLGAAGRSLHILATP
jgi:hypothetical protein